MTKNECAIVTAYTGIVMLTGDDSGVFYDYASRVLGHDVWTHEMASEKFWDDLKEASKNDFIDLCMNAKDSEPTGVNRESSENEPGPDFYVRMLRKSLRDYIRPLAQYFANIDDKDEEEIIDDILVLAFSDRMEK